MRSRSSSHPYKQKATSIQDGNLHEPEQGTGRQRMQRPVRVSVALSTFQGEAHLNEQLQSIECQTVPPDEIVASDDASTDATRDILLDFRARSRIPVTVLTSPTNLGLIDNVSRSMRACTGDVIALCDQDDIWDPDKVRTLKAAFSVPNPPELWFSNALLVDATGTSLTSTTYEALRVTEDMRHRIESGGALRQLVHASTVTGATAAIRSDLIDALLPIPKGYVGPSGPLLHDGWLALLAHLTGRIEMDQRCLIKYRQHEAQYTAMSIMGGLTDRPSERRLRTSNQRGQAIAAESGVLQLLSERVRHRPQHPWLPDRVAEARELESFLRGRDQGLSTSKLRFTVTNLANGNYRRYARGLVSALSDLYRK